MSKPVKPMWIYSAGGTWSRVYDADEVERHLGPRHFAQPAETRVPLDAMKLISYRDWWPIA